MRRRLTFYNWSSCLLVEGRCCDGHAMGTNLWVERCLESRAISRGPVGLSEWRGLEGSDRSTDHNFLDLNHNSIWTIDLEYSHNILLIVEWEFWRSHPWGAAMLTYFAAEKVNIPRTHSRYLFTLSLWRQPIAVSWKSTHVHIMKKCLSLPSVHNKPI